MDAEECWIQGGVNHHLKVFSSDRQRVNDLTPPASTWLAVVSKGTGPYLMRPNSTDHMTREWIAKLKSRNSIFSFQNSKANYVKWTSMDESSSIKFLSNLWGNLICATFQLKCLCQLLTALAADIRRPSSWNYLFFWGTLSTSHSNDRRRLIVGCFDHEGLHQLQNWWIDLQLSFHYWLWYDQEFGKSVDVVMY